MTQGEKRVGESFDGGPVAHAEDYEPVEADAPTRIPWAGLIGLCSIAAVVSVVLYLHL